MKMKLFFLTILVSLVVAVSAFASDFDSEGTLTYHNDVLSWDVSVDGTTDSLVFTSSWDDGNFDPMLQVWDAVTGDLINQQDDGGYTGTLTSNGVSYDLGTWDTYYSLDLDAGTYILTLSTYYNWASGNYLDGTLSFIYDDDTPILVTEWDQPANSTGHDGNFYSVHFTGVGDVVDNNTGGSIDPVPEPSTLLLFGLGLVGCAARYRKQVM